MKNKDWGGNKRTTYAQLGASNHCDHERQNEDFYATDSIAIDKLKAVYDIPKNIVEISAGNGHLSERLKELGHNVIYSHIDYGQDYFKYEPEKWDIMVTNPFYTGKREVVQRALDFGKPFALLLPLTWLNDSAPKQLFKDKDLQLLMFDKRIKFTNNGKVENKITFSSAYYCYNLLPKQIIMRELKETR